MEDSPAYPTAEGLFDDLVFSILMTIRESCG